MKNIIAIFCLGLAWLCSVTYSQELNWSARPGFDKSRKVTTGPKENIPTHTLNGYRTPHEGMEIIQSVQTDDFLCNDDFVETTTPQIFASAAMDESGNFVIVWQDERNGNRDIYYQRYNSSGVAQGPNSKANDDAGTTDQWYPSVAMDKSGSFVIAWVDSRNGNGEWDIYYQQYNSSGVKQGANSKANEIPGTEAEGDPSVGKDGNGNFVIAWTQVTGTWPSVSRNVYYQRFNSAGVAQGVNSKVNDGVGQGVNPSVAMNGNGDFVIAWMDYRGIYYQRYNSLGEAQGQNSKAEDVSESASTGSPSVAMDESGNFVIAWSDGRNAHEVGKGGYYTDIYYQRFNSLGVAQGTNIRANDVIGGSTSQLFCSPSASMDGDGNFIIAWEDSRYGDFMGDTDVYYQCYNSSGIAQGANMRANDDTEDN